MNPTGVCFVLLFVCGVFQLCVFAAALPFHRTFQFKDIADPYRRQYVELIANRQIRNHNNDSAGSRKQQEAHSPAAAHRSESAEGSLHFLIRPPAEHIVAMNDRLILMCEVSGSPPPVVYWLKNGQQIAESPFDAEEATNRIQESESLLPTKGLASTVSKLVIDCVDGEAEAIYTCVAESVNEKVVASTYVHIEGEAPYNESVCSLRHESESLPASVFMWSGTYLELEGREALLLCRTASNPAAKITWYDRDDKPIVNGLGKYQVMWTGDLLIPNLNWNEDMGVFKCRTENALGHDEVTTFIYPLVPDMS